MITAARRPSSLMVPTAAGVGSATKGAMHLLSKSMALKLARDGIRVNCIAPGIGGSALLVSFMGVPDTPENRARF